MALAVAPLLRDTGAGKGTDTDAGAGADGDLARDLAELHRIYWAMLDLMNALPVAPGQVVMNAVPVPGDPGRVTTAVHALGNPERREVLLLEVRRPAPTLRVWDNVRFPLREVDVEGSLAVMPLAATAFLVGAFAVTGDFKLQEE